MIGSSEEFTIAARWKRGSRCFWDCVGGVRRGVYSRHVSWLAATGDCMLLRVIFLCLEVRCSLRGQSCCKSSSRTDFFDHHLRILSNRRARRYARASLSIRFLRITRAKLHLRRLANDHSQRYLPTSLLFCHHLSPEARASLPRTADPGDFRADHVRATLHADRAAHGDRADHCFNADGDRIACIPCIAPPGPDFSGKRPRPQGSAVDWKGEQKANIGATASFWRSALPTGRRELASVLQPQLGAERRSMNRRARQWTLPVPPPTCLPRSRRRAGSAGFWKVTVLVS